MFCPKCGNQLAEGTNFCVQCGESIADKSDHAPINNAGTVANMLTAQASKPVFTYISIGVALLCLILIFQDLITVNFGIVPESASIYGILSDLRNVSQASELFSGSSETLSQFTTLFYGLMGFAILNAVLYALFIASVLGNKKKVGLLTAGLICTALLILALQVLVIFTNICISSHADRYIWVFSITTAGYIAFGTALVARYVLPRRVAKEG